ncbi:MAG: crossover junction endodeoxyribonuclease RuvC [Pseudomonadota bacterium]
MRVLGIDPGSNITGYGILENKGGVMRHIDNGSIAPRAKLSFPKRLSIIYDELTELIERFCPNAVAIENVFVAKNVRSSLILGHVRGVAMLAAASSGIEIGEYTPAQVKIAITGSGRASKEQIQSMVRAILRLPETACEDASDALAVAICHCNSTALRNKIKKHQV